MLRLLRAKSPRNDGKMVIRSNLFNNFLVVIYLYLILPRNKKIVIGGHWLLTHHSQLTTHNSQLIMIVPGMTLVEIKKSLLNDYNNGLHQKIRAIDIIYKRKFQLNKNHDFVETITYPAASKNDWRIIIYCTKNHVHTVPYLYSYDHVGITATHLNDMYTPLIFMHFNSHFFKRYKERIHLDIVKPQELVKLFFRKNTYILPCSDELEDGTKQVFSPLDGGVGLGIFHEADNIYEFKTFVDNSLLGDNQKKKITEIYRDTLEKIVESLKTGKNL